MPVYPEPSRRYPKRQLKSVVYSETASSPDDLDEDSIFAAVVAGSGAVTIDEGGSSESDEDWVSRGVASNTALGGTDGTDPECKPQETKPKAQGQETEDQKA